MIKTLPIALCAGLASALFLSVLGTLGSGISPLAFLSFMAPLPLFIAGLGWGYKTAALGAIVGIVVLFFIANPAISVSYLIIVALPAALLTYFALMSRQDENAGSHENIEWYPLGRVVVIGAVISSALALFLLFIVGGDLDKLYKTFEQMFSLMGSGTGGLSELANSDPETAKIVKRFLVVFAPAAGAASWFVATLANMYLAQKILTMAGKAIRTEASLEAITYPQTYLICFAGSLALSFLDGIPGFVAGVFAAVGIVAYAIIGFITIHKITAGHTFQILILGLMYLAVILFQWLALIIVMAIGLFDSFFDLRNKFNNKKET